MRTVYIYELFVRQICDRHYIIIRVDERPCAQRKKVHLVRTYNIDQI